MSENKPLFRNLDANDPDPETTEIESLCMNCGENVRYILYISYIQCIQFFKLFNISGYDTTSINKNTFL